MAKKNPASVINDPPTASSSEEVQNSPKKPPPSASLQPQHSSSESGSESYSDSESEDDRSDATADPKLKPSASKSMEYFRKGKNSSSQHSEFLSRSAMKRPIGNNSQGNDLKRVKKRTDSRAYGKVSAEDDGNVKKLFQRVWSEEDEIAILKGAVDYRGKTETDPSKNMDAFHDFIKKSLHVDVSKNQLMDKFRRLRKKYKNNAKRGKNGQDPTFTKPHDKNVYEVSKLIWAAEGSGGESIEFNGKLMKDVGSGRNAPSLERIATPLNSGLMTCLNEMMSFCKGLDEDFLRRGLENIGESERAELVEKWKELQISQLELFVKRAELVKCQAKLILEAFK